MTFTFLRYFFGTWDRSSEKFTVPLLSTHVYVSAKADDAKRKTSPIITNGIFDISSSLQVWDLALVARATLFRHAHSTASFTDFSPIFILPAHSPAP
jgi:hypothetical protein